MKQRISYLRFWWLAPLLIFALIIAAVWHKLTSTIKAEGLSFNSVKTTIFSFVVLFCIAGLIYLFRPSTVKKKICKKDVGENNKEIKDDEERDK